MTTNSTTAEDRLAKLGIKLPAPPEPFGIYVEAVQTGNLLFLTGMLPTEGRAAKFIGRVGAELDVAAGRKAAYLAALNGLAVAREHLGSLDKATRIVRLGVSVATSGDVRGQPEAADGASELLPEHFGTIDVLVNNAGIFYTKPFTDFTTDDFNALASVNLLGFLYITQLSVKQMLKQKSGSVVTISGSLADNPIAGVNASVSMITKGGLNTVTRSLAIEYAKEGIRFNAVAPGVVDTPLHKGDSKEFLKTLQPMGRIADVKDVVDAVLYLAQANQVTGEVLHVDGGAHAGRW